MLSCFPCVRSGRFTIEPTSISSKPADKCSSSSEEGLNYFNEMNKDPCSLIAEVKTHLNMGSFAHSKDMDFSVEDKNFITSMRIHSPRLIAKEEALIQQFDGYREENEQLVVSTIVVRNGTICDGYIAEDGSDEYNVTEHISSMNTPIKEIFFFKEEKKKDLICSSLDDDFIKDKVLDRNEAKKDKLSRKLVSSPDMLAQSGTMHYSKPENKCTQIILDSFADGEELLKKAIPEEGPTCAMQVACTDTDNHQNAKSDYNETIMSGESSSTQDEEEKQGTRNVAHADYNGYYGKGDISQSKLKPEALFSYGISDQQRDFLFLCAGLVIQAVGFQLRSIVEVATTLILLCYRAYIFVGRFTDTLSRARQKLAEAMLFQGAIDSSRIALHMERWEAMKPLIIQGAKKMGWGCLNAAYVIALLTALLLASFLFSYLAVIKGGAYNTQKPIHIRKELYFDYTKAHPVASLDLFSLDAYSRIMGNASKLGIKVNPAGASLRYRGTLLLTLPESDHNRQLGVFQVKSEILSEKGEMMEKGSQPCMLMFKSNTLQYVKAIGMAAPLLTGIASETQTLRLQVLEWEHSASARVLQVVLVPRAGRAISTGLPQLYQSHILLDSLPSPFIPSSSSTILSTLFMWLLLSFLIFACLSSFCMYRMHHRA